MVECIPSRIIRDRPDNLSPMQAICHWLVDDPDGPDLTHQEAADTLGYASRGTVQLHLQRARDNREAPA